MCSYFINLSPDDIRKLSCFSDKTENIVIDEFNWYWDFCDNKHAQISVRFCGIFILGYKKGGNKVCRFIEKCYLVKLQRCISQESREEQACVQYWKNKEAEEKEVQQFELGLEQQD